MDLPIRCSKCKKISFYLPKEYSINVAIVCVGCHGGKKTKIKETLSQKFQKIKKGIRKDIHSSYFFRSPTEANFARILQILNIEWKFEERNFSFAGYKRKPFMYIMDFEIIKGNKLFPSGFYEIKGYLNSNGRQKLRRLKKCYPEEFKITTLVIYTKYKKKDIEFAESIGLKYMFYDELTKKFSNNIPFWEGKK